MYRQAVIDYAAERYQTEPVYLWQKHPGFAVLRHEQGGKWYAVLMAVEASKLGLAGGGIPLMNVKAAPDLVHELRGQTGFLPAYHMNKTHWLSVRLDGTVDMQTLTTLLDGSYVLTKQANRLSETAGMVKT